MKKLYSIFAVTFLLTLFTGLQWTFAKDTPKKETLPIPKPVYKNPFKPLPFKAMLPSVELYEFNTKAYTFDKIVGLQPILIGKEWQAVSNDPIKFTLTPSKITAQLGEEIELTLTAELLDVSPQLLFTFDELRNYTIKVILPKDFIQIGGTYYDFVSGTLDPAHPKQTYTIKGRYLDKPSLDGGVPTDCFKVLRKLNDEVFILKNTTCINVTDIDLVSNIPAETVNTGRETLVGIDISKLKFFGSVSNGYGEIIKDFYDSGSYSLICYSKYGGSGYFYEVQFPFFYADLPANIPVGSIKLEVYYNNSLFAPSTKIYSSLNMGLTSIMTTGPAQIRGICKVYNSIDGSGTPIFTKTIDIITDETPCPTQTVNTLSIAAPETALCPGTATVLTATTNCIAANISWQKDGIAYGTNGATLAVSTSGTYKAVCNSPALVSNLIDISVSSIPAVPSISTNRHAITPGEFATLTATNCQGTVVWSGSNNFEDVGDEISVGKPGNYQALCRTSCNGTISNSSLSTIINISLLPLRLQADKYEKYANETAQISAFGCTNGYISWKVNGEALPQSSNPLTAYSTGTYSAQCKSYNGASSDWVSIYIGEKNANTPRLTASKSQAYPSDNVVLSASGCPSGWYYKWEIPIRESNGSSTIQRPIGSELSKIVKGPATYKVQCLLNDQTVGPQESVTVSELHVEDVVIAITANKTEANIGESVIFTAIGNCPNGGGIRWMANGMNIGWSWVGETFQVTGPGTYAARCESGYQISPTVFYTVKMPKPGSVSIIADKTRVKDNELVTLRAIGCDKEVNWTLPNGTEVAGSSILFNFGPGVYKAKCIRFGFSSDPASITIAQRNWNEPVITGTNSSIGINQLAELTITGCPNNWAGWRIPEIDINGNPVVQGTSLKTILINKPGIYYYACAIGDYTTFMPIVIHAAATDALVIKPSKTSANPGESVILTAYGCPNGIVQWQNGTTTTTGTRITVTGPGLRMAKCVGDYSNNGDWAAANIRSLTNIVPFLTATSPSTGLPITEACPNEPVTITASNCPNGWWYQTQFVKPNMLNYWLSHRHGVDEGIGYLDVFGFAGGSVNTTGPNIYFARCISPDGSWMGEFSDKYVVIDPAFPADLRATNNGPALTGATSVSLAVTDVPGASYSWTNGGTFTSTARSPLINTPTEANAGIYKVTLKRGTTEAWACSTTATTKLTVSGCDIRIKASDPTTGVETYVLPFVDGSISTFRDLALSAERYDGTDPQGMTYIWTKPDGTTANTSYLIANKPGRYTLSVSPMGSPSIVCKAFVTISEGSAYKMLLNKVKSKVFPDGTPVKMVPLQYEEMYYTLTRNGVEEKIDIAENYLLFYSSAGVKKVDMMQVIPTYGYSQTHSSVNDADFSGLIVFTEKDGKTFKKGWRFNNGVLNQTITTANIRQARALNPNDDCVIKMFSKWSSPGGSQTVSNNSNQIHGGNTDGSYTAKNPGTTYTLVIDVLNIDCCLIAPAGCGPNNPNNPPPFGTGGGTPEPEPSDIAKKLCGDYTTLIGQANNNAPQTPLVNTNCGQDAAAAAKFSLYAKLIDESVKKEFAKNTALQPYISKMTPATDAQLANAADSYSGTAYNPADPAGLIAAGCAMTQNFQADPAHPITGDQADLIGEALKNATNDAKVAYSALSKLLNPCSSSQDCSAPSPQALAVMNTIMTSLKTRKGAVINGIQWSDFGDRMGMEAGDIKNVFNDLATASGNGTYPDPANPNIIRLLPLNGPFSGISFTYNSATNQLDIRNCNNTVSMMDATVPPPMNDCMTISPNGRLEDNPIYPFVKESFLNTLTQRGETMQGMGIVGCNTCTLTNKGDWGENTYWLFTNSTGSNYWIVRELGTTKYRYAFDADPKINNNDNLSWISWEPDFGEEVTAGAKFSQNTALAFAGTLGVIVSAPVIVGTVIPALIQSASTITLQGVMEEVIINTMLSLATGGNINPTTLAKSTVDDIFTGKLIEKIPALVGKKFQVPLKTFNVLKDWLIKKGTNTVSLSYLQNIKTIAKPFTDKVRSYADAIRNKIDDLCGNAKDKIKVTATSLKLFDNIDDVVKLFDNTNPTKTININGKIFGEVAGAANGETVKMFEGATQTEIRQYAENLAGGVLTEVSPGKVWTKIAADGTKINLRNISKSNISDWTIDVINDAKLTPVVKQKGIEIKFR